MVKKAKKSKVSRAARTTRQHQFELFSDEVNHGTIEAFAKPKKLSLREQIKYLQEANVKLHERIEEARQHQMNAQARGDNFKELYEQERDRVNSLIAIMLNKGK